MGLNPFNLIMGKKYTAVDFGHHNLKVVECRVQGDDITVLSMGEQRLPGGAIENGQVDDADMVAGELENLMNSNSISPKNIIFSPAVGQEFVRKHSMPQMPEDELGEALHWELEEYLNMPPEDVASDYLVLEENEDGLEVLLVGLPNMVLGSYLSVFNKMNFSPRVAGVQDLALISLLIYQERLNEPSLIVNMGEETSRFIIAREDNFYLSRSVEIGGRHFTRVFKNPDRTWEEAEKAKMEASLPEISEGEEENEGELDIDLMVNEMESGGEGEVELEALAEDLVSEINRSLDFYESRFANGMLSHMYVTGGGFRLQGLKEYISSEIELELSEINSMESMTDKISTHGGGSDKMAVALGLIAGEVLHDEG